MTGPVTMVALVEDYLAQRRGLGFALGIAGRQLLNFARFADADGHRGPLTLDLAVRWATQPSRRVRRFPARRLDIVRPFARYRAAFDAATVVPPRGLLGPPRRRPTPYIFSRDEVGALVAAARQLPPVTGLRPATFATLFGLLAATGLRVSEARRLTRDDVDLTAAVLTIRATKFRKSRLVAVHPTTRDALRAYAAQRERARPRPAAPTFFVTAHGAPVPYSTVRMTFRRLCATLGWDTRRPRPRIHDLRHSFACRRVQQWYADGVEVAPRIAVLATYLGHAKISDTYWYLTGTPELLACAASRFEAHAADAPGDLR